MLASGRLRVHGWFVIRNFPPILRWVLVLSMSLAGGLRSQEAETPEPTVAETTTTETAAAEPAPEVAAEPAPGVEVSEPAVVKGRPAKVMVIPIREAIMQPELYILRRGIKQAINDGVDTVILDMNTPGGSIAVTFEMLQVLDRFPGKTVTFVNTDAISAGALISAGTDQIFFAPTGVIGAAAPVLATGGDLSKSMRSKIVSYLKAKVRSFSGEEGFRSEVISAMIDEDFEFKIGDEVIKAKGELLSLTAKEAMKMYGDPPVPLLGAGIVEDLDELVVALHGPGAHQVTRMETSWSERVAQHITGWASVMMGIGLLLLFLEFKTPGFGLPGILGGVLMLAVFFGHYLAGLSGHEPLLFFLLGVVLVLVELFFFPGLVVFALSGLLLMLGSLVWSMADLWPGEEVEFSAEVFMGPLLSMMTGVGIALVAFLLLLRFLPRGGLWGRMVLETSVGGNPGGPQPLAGGSGPILSQGDLGGATGVAVTPLMPSGQVEIGGRRYEARLSTGHAERGVAVRVLRLAEFGLEVEEVKP